MGHHVDPKKPNPVFGNGRSGKCSIILMTAQTYYQVLNNRSVRIKIVVGNFGKTTTIFLLNKNSGWKNPYKYTQTWFISHAVNQSIGADFRVLLVVA